MINFVNEMKNTQFTYQKNKLTKWLLSVTLFFCVFNFTAYAGNSQSISFETAKTELIISNNYKAFKRIISFKKALEFITCNDFSINSYKNWTNTLLNYNLLIKVKFISMSRAFCSYNTTRNFLQAKTFPQSSDEDFILTFKG